MSEKVLFLAYSNPNMPKDPPSERTVLSCGFCRNKTFMFWWEGEQKYPMVQCGACQAEIGCYGFVGDRVDETQV